MIKRPYMRWTQDTETAFLLALRQTGTARAAAAAIGRCAQSAYTRRRRQPEFRERWDAMVAEWQAQWIEQRGTKVAETAPRERWDGWSDVRRRAFLRALAETGAIAEAADRVGMSRSAVTRLKARSPEYATRDETDTALLKALDRIAQHRRREAVVRADAWQEYERAVIAGEREGLVP